MLSTNIFQFPEMRDDGPFMVEEVQVQDTQTSTGRGGQAYLF